MFNKMICFVGKHLRRRSFSISENGTSSVWGISPDSPELFSLASSSNFLPSSDRPSEEFSDSSNGVDVDKEDFLPFAINDNRSRNYQHRHEHDSQDSYSNSPVWKLDTTNVGGFLQELKNAPPLRVTKQNTYGSLPPTRHSDEPSPMSSDKRMVFSCPYANLL